MKSVSSIFTGILGQRPKQSVIVITQDGRRYDLGKQVSGSDFVAKYYRWRQNKKIKSYCRDRLKTLTGTQKQEFLQEMNRLQEN